MARSTRTTFWGSFFFGPFWFWSARSARKDAYARGEDGSRYTYAWLGGWATGAISATVVIPLIAVALLSAVASEGSDLATLPAFDQAGTAEPAPQPPGLSSGGTISLPYDDVVQLPAIDPSSMSAMRSKDDTQPTTIEFENLTTQAIAIYWIDYDGMRVKYADLSPGTSYVQQTYVTHPWIVTDEAGRVYGLYLPAAQPGRVSLNR